MASNSVLRLRRTAAQLHALAQVEREIRANDSKGRCRYLREFSESFHKYERVLTSRELLQAVSRADVLLVGDYHALPASQRYVCRLVEELATSSGRQVVLALEAIFARHQPALDEWTRGEIEEDELRERIRYDLDWGYDWLPYRELLTAGRQWARAIYGVDCMPRSDLRRISARDRHAAIQLEEIREQHPEAILLVLFGESHLAPNHLPALLRARLPRDHIVTLLQNVDALYWRAAGERHERVEAVRVSDDVYCAFTSTPLEKYESYRLCIERWRLEGSARLDLAPSVYNLIDALLRFLRVDKYSPSIGPQPRFLVDLLPDVCFRETCEQHQRLLRRRRIADRDARQIVADLEQRGICHVPQLNAILVREFRVEHGSEEAARFLHRACQGRLLAGEAPTLGGEDRFYARVLEHALAYFGSRVLCPGRAPVRESDLYLLYSCSREELERQPLAGSRLQVGVHCSYREFMEMLDFLALHKDFEATRRRYQHVPDLIRAGLEYRGEKFEYVTRQLGYMLGSELYDGYLRGRAGKRFLRSLFLRRLDRPGAARALYNAAIHRVRSSSRKLN